MNQRILLAALAAVMLSGCGGDDDESCDPSKADACEGGLVCEEVQGGKAQCFPETAITGKVLNATSQQPVAGARLVALDATTSAAATAVVTSDAQGNYRIPVKLTRSTDAAADVKSFTYTLRVESKGFLGFPSAIRQAIPLTVNRADDANAPAQNVRDVALLPLTHVNPAELGSIAGKVAEGTAGQGGVLVVAEGVNGTSGATSTVTDTSGSFQLLNLPAGTYDVKAFVQGKGFAPVTALSLATAEDKIGVNLTADAAPALTSLAGGVNIVNAPAGANETSIVLALASTGEVPRGLSIQTSGQRFSLAGIPAGTYDILASYTNDSLVLDPDPQQLPRPIRITLPKDASSGSLDVGTFKVTGDVGIVSPGRDDVPNEAAVAAAGLTFRWEDDSSENFYGLELFDAYGTRIWGSEPSTTLMPTVQAAKNATSKAYDGPALTAGQTYQWRITSWTNCTNNCNGALYKPISRSENLRGIFTVAP
ncbi:carboxypeptidase-like regulatory domain-containing protein [Corallococcus sp. CA053C]|uniref:carboxypeptidase-like regulatory domain-containing protein n=1 Tax=Corallococcus sp. CA053C TaxID=2316732 RepID=UPI0013152F37|nr:carboxypeptidase-like regulatory domain-containing protein [Corallococcus sp. CA053C]